MRHKLRKGDVDQSLCLQGLILIYWRQEVFQLLRMRVFGNLQVVAET